MSINKSRKLSKSFKYAIDGLIYCFKTQRNMRIHAAVALAVLLLSYAVGLSALETAIILFAVALVIITEMINTAIETVVDRIGTEYHPLAEIAKNVAAGAVLIATITAAAIGIIIFVKKLGVYL